VRLDGFEALRSRLADFPDRTRRNALRGGARAAAAFLARRLKARLQGDGLATAAGSVRSKARLYGDDRVVGTVQYGGQYTRGRGDKRTTKDAWYAHILEWGAKPHVIRPQARRGKKAALQIGGRFVKKVRHPGIRARLYATTTARQDLPEAMRVYERYVETRVDRYWRTGK
jgi:hypothetical protein